MTASNRTDTRERNPRKWRAILLIALAAVVIAGVIWRVDTAPRTDDAYAYADTINVSPEVSGRIVTLAVRDNQSVKRGDLLFQIDPRRNLLSLTLRYLLHSVASMRRYLAPPEHKRL
jgi:multidrug efflux system membrane fusion protein